MPKKSPARKASTPSRQEQTNQLDNQIAEVEATLRGISQPGREENMNPSEPSSSKGNQKGKADQQVPYSKKAFLVGGENSLVPEPLEQESLDAISATVMDAIFIYDDLGVLRYANKAAVEMLGKGLAGLTREQLAKCAQLSYPDGEPVPVEELPSHLATSGETIQGRFYRFTDRNGHPRSALISASPLIDMDFRTTGAVVTWRDITELERLNEEKWYQHSLLETVLETDPGCVAVVAGTDLVFQVADPQYRRITPNPETDPVGRKFEEVWPGTEGEEEKKQLLHVLESGASQDGKLVEKQLSDGQVHKFISYLRPLDWDRRPAVLIALWEITRLEQAYYQEQALLAQQGAALAESRQQVAEILESIDDGLFALDRNWNFIYINRRAAQADSLKPEELVGKNIWESWPQLLGTPLEKHYRRAMAERVPINFEIKGILTNAWYEVRVFPSESGISVYWIDISERKLLEQRLSYHSLLLNTIHEAVMSTGIDEQIKVWNQAAEELTGWKAEEVIGKKLSEVISRVEPQTPEEIELTWGPLLEGKAVNQEVAVYRKDGSQVLLSSTTAPVFDGEGQLIGYVSAARDITEQKQAEAALQQAYNEMESRVKERTQELTELQWRLIESIEAERLRVSRELHDEPMQEIYALLYQANLLANSMEDARWRSEMELFQQRLKAVSESLRSIAYNLRPVSLTELGLEKALREYISRVQFDYPQIKIKLHLQPDQYYLTEAQRLALFRVCQVGLINVVRHSQASRAEVRFFCKNGLAVLEIEDNGRGFEVPINLLSLARKGHLGLIGAAERVEALGGILELHSLAAKGTRLVVSIPIPSQEG